MSSLGLVLWVAVTMTSVLLQGSTNICIFWEDEVRLLLYVINSDVYKFCFIEMDEIEVCWLLRNCDSVVMQGQC